MRVSYQLQHSYSAEVDIDSIADNLSDTSTDDEIDDTIVEDLMTGLISEGDIPSPHIHGIEKVREAVRDYIASRGEE